MPSTKSYNEKEKSRGPYQILPPPVRRSGLQNQRQETSQNLNIQRLPNQIGSGSGSQKIPQGHNLQRPLTVTESGSGAASLQATNSNFEIPAVDTIVANQRIPFLFDSLRAAFANIERIDKTLTTFLLGQVSLPTLPFFVMFFKCHNYTF